MTPTTPCFRFHARTFLIAFLAIITLGLGTNALAEGEDVTDNEVCLECHTDTDRSAAPMGDTPRVHNDDGSLIVEDHDMWSCVDCHVEVEELPHPDGMVAKEVDCLSCHEDMPEG